MNEKYIKHLTFEAKEIDRENFTITGVFSTPDVDRHGEIVDQKGWRLDEYMLNPVILFAHDQYQPAIGQMIELGVSAGVLQGKIKFAAEEYDFAKTIFNLYAGGYMRAFSVGFENNRWEINEDDEQVILLENTLFEVSCVNVPANQLALAKSKGVDVSPIEKKIAKAKNISDKILTKEIDSEVKEADIVITPESATDLLKTQKADIIKSAIGELQSALHSLTADEGKHPEIRSVAQQKSKKKKQVKKSINRAIRKLLKAKN